jgi:hypothetical protein
MHLYQETYRYALGNREGDKINRKISIHKTEKLGQMT